MVFAEEVSCWKSSTTSPDVWIERAKKEIVNVGGTIAGEAFISQGDKQAFVLMFTIGDEPFRVEWPVLPIDLRKKRTAAQLETDRRAARIQAATLLQHDVKHKAVMAKVFGARTAFVQFLMLPNGQTVGAVNRYDIAELLPQAVALLPSGGER